MPGFPEVLDRTRLTDTGVFTSKVDRGLLKFNAVIIFILKKRFFPQKLAKW